MEKRDSLNIPKEQNEIFFSQTYFHGTKADLKVGDFIKVGITSNYGQRSNSKYIYLAATLETCNHLKKRGVSEKL